MNISYSSISSYLICPSRYFFSKQPGKVARSASLIYGSAFHELLARRFRGEQVSVKDVLSSYLTGKPKESENNWDGKVVYGSKDWRPDVMEIWMQDAANLVLSLPTKPQAVEMKLTRDFGDFTLTGVIDTLWGGKLVDFKLTASRFFRADVLQAACYALLNGGPSQFQFFVFHRDKTPRLEPINVKETQDQQYLDWVVNRIIRPTAKAIKAGNFPANPSHNLCSQDYCSYWAICRKTGERNG